MMAGCSVREPTIAAKGSATWPIDLPANASRCALACAVVSGSSGHPRVSATHPAVSNRSAQRAQLLFVGQQPQTVDENCRGAPRGVRAPYLPSFVLGRQRRADGLIGGHEYSSFSAGDTCPGVWTLPRHILSASDDRVRVCGIPSRYPCLPSPGSLGQLARPGGDPPATP
jgi:hypothetical protein